MENQYSNQQIQMDKSQDYSSVLQVRLDTAPILERIEAYLTGKIQTYYIGENNKPIFQDKQISQPKANDEGIHWLLNFVSNIINPATVQGNFVSEHIYYQYLFDIHSALILLLMRNMYKWDIKDYDSEPIIETIMAIITPYMTRLLANEERKSYMQTMRVAESSMIEQKTKGFSLNPFNRGGGN
jgi:hypothetical protein